MKYFIISIIFLAPFYLFSQTERPADVDASLFSGTADSLAIGIFPGLPAGTQFSLRPNPANTYTWLRLRGLGRMQLVSGMLLDVSGQIRQSWTGTASYLGNYTQLLDVSALEEGVFLVRIAYGGQAVTTRMVVNH